MTVMRAYKMDGYERR